MSTNLVRLLRPVSDSPAIFARPGHNDHKLLCQLISEGRAGVAGCVFDPSFVEEQDELLRAVNGRNLWSILDPKSLELSTPGGFTARRRTLPWAGMRPHAAPVLEGNAGAEFAKHIVEFLLQHQFSAVFAPTHYLEKGFGDAWLTTDLRLLQLVRDELDRNGGKSVAIYYPLCVSTSTFFDAAQRVALKVALKKAPRPDALWLRIHPFGGQSGHVTLESYIRAARDMQELEVPLVGEKVGNVGTALLAFGALGGLEIGVSSGEAFDYKRLLQKRPATKGFAPHRGVLLDALGISLEVKAAKVFFENRTLRAQYACRDAQCCRQGYTDTLKEPRRHFLLSRLGEVSKLGTAPFRERPSLYLERHLRPATDKLGRVAQADLPKPIMGRIEREQRKLSGWRNTLGELSRVPLMSAAKVPAKRVERMRGAA